MGATIPVRPSVDVGGIAWVQRARFWWAGEFAGTHYHLTHGEPRPGDWCVLYSNGGPFRELTGGVARIVVDALVAWLVKHGKEVPA